MDDAVHDNGTSEALAALLRLADSVADGEQVNRADVGAGSQTDDGLLEQLRIIDAVARMHRDQSTLADADAAAGDDGPAPLEPGDRWRQLEIVARVGGGTFGDVYRAHDTQLDRDVALKLLRQRAHPAVLTSQILAEGRLLARVAHPNVITIYGAEEADGRVGLWMEFVNGLTLEDVLRQSGSLSAREATVIGMDLCRALAAVHAMGLVHRDVKAPNVMREQGGRIVLMDFGTGENLGGHGSGRLAGTPLYLAPELFVGQAATVPSDLYALGVLLYRLATGAYPVNGTSVADLAAAHRNGRAVRLRDARPNLPDGFVRVVERALAPAPEDRFESAGAFESALVGWLGIGGRAPADSADAGAGAGARVSAAVSKSVRKPRAPLPTSWIAGLLVAIAIAVVAAIGVWRRPSVRPAAAPVVTAPEAIRSIAVLPLQNLGGGDYFADGMTEALIADLGRTGVLDVISRTSVMRFKGSQLPLPEIAKALNVDAVIEGSVLRDGRKVRITAQLIDARTDRHLWSNSYDRDVRDVLALQGDVARAIAREVHFTLTKKAEARLSVGRTPVSEQALDAYLQGRYYWNRRGTESLTQAIDFFDQAIRLEPKYAAAYAGLADTYILLGSVGGIMRPAEAMGKAKSAAQQALALDDSLAESHTSLAMIHFWFDWDWPGAEREFARALEVNRNYPTAHHWYAIYLSAMGRHDAAMIQIDLATRLDPVSAIIHASRGWVQYQRRQYDAAIDESRKTLEIDPGFARADNYIGMSYMKKGMVDQALPPFLESSRLLKGAPVTQSQLAGAYAVSGRADEAHRILADLLKPGKYPYVNPADIAEVYVWLGEPDRAMDWLEKALADRSFSLVYLKVHPAYDALRQTPRFLNLLSRMHFP